MSMKYFIVFQNKTYKKEKEKSILWAPKIDKGGNKAKFYWSSMEDCKVGDIVFSIVKNEVVSRGVVLKEAVDSINPFTNDMWTEEGWLVQLEYNHAIDSFRSEEHT